MIKEFPGAVPEIPVKNVDDAAWFYENCLGFTKDWGGDEGGIGQVSRGSCRIFFTNTSFRQSFGNYGPVIIWLNLKSIKEVDELFEEWNSKGANIISKPESKPWKLHEFTALDLDENRLRVFYDFSSDLTGDE